MSKVIRFLTRTAGNRETAERVGTADIIAYAYLLLGVFIIAVPVLWTFVSSFKPDTAIESFDTRVLPYDEVMTQIEGVGEKAIYIHTPEDGDPQEVYKSGPTRRITKVAPIDDPTAEFDAPRTELQVKEEIRIAILVVVSVNAGTAAARVIYTLCS